MISFLSFLVQFLCSTKQVLLYVCAVVDNTTCINQTYKMGKQIPNHNEDNYEKNKEKDVKIYSPQSKNKILITIMNKEINENKYIGKHSKPKNFTEKTTI